MNSNVSKAVESISGGSKAPAAVTAVPSPAASVVGELIKEADAAVQQQLAVSANTPPPAAHIKPESEAVMAEAAAVAEEKLVEEQPKVVETSPFHQLTAALMVTLDLSQNFMVGHKKLLSEMQVGDNLYNLYSPMKKAGKKDKPTPPGILRDSFDDILDVTDAINSSKIMILGKKSDILPQINTSIQKVVGQISHMLPLTQDALVTTLVDAAEEEGEEPNERDIHFSDLVRVTGWVNSPMFEGEVHEIEAIAEHNAVINLTVNAGALYDAEEQMKYISQIDTLLGLFASKRGEAASTMMLLSVLINPSDLAEQPARDLLDTLLTEGGYTLYTRSELLEGNAANWLPTTKASVDRDLLTKNGEMLLIRLIGSDDEEEGEAGAEPAEGEAAAE